MNGIHVAVKGIVMELVGGILVIATIFFGVVTIVAICSVVDKAKGVIRGRP